MLITMSCMGACRGHWQQLQPSRSPTESGEVTGKPSSLVKVISLLVHDTDPPKSQKYLSGEACTFLGRRLCSDLDSSKLKCSSNLGLLKILVMRSKTASSASLGQCRIIHLL